MACEISVVAAMRNAGAFLLPCLESVAAQTFRDYEFVLVDDGSTDDSASIAENFARKFPGWTVLRRSACGLPSALNEGMRCARGRYIARLDMDDLCLPQRFTEQFDYMERHSDCVLLGAGVDLIDEKGRVLGQRFQYLEHSDIERELLLGNGGAVSQPVCMMRTEALRAVGYHDPKFPIAVDLDIFLKLSQCGKIANLPQTLLQWRQHPKSLAARRGAEYDDIRLQILSEHIQRTGLEYYLRAVSTPAISRHEMGWPEFCRSASAWNGRLSTAWYYCWRTAQETGWSRRNALFFAAVPILALRARLNALCDRLKQGPRRKKGGLGEDFKC